MGICGEKLEVTNNFAKCKVCGKEYKMMDEKKVRSER